MSQVEPGAIVISRRAVLGAAVGGVAALGLGACAGRSNDPDSSEESSTDDRDSARGLAGVPVEVWRDPG